MIDTSFDQHPDTSPEVSPEIVDNFEQSANGLPDGNGLPPEASQEDADQQEAQEFVPLGNPSGVTETASESHVQTDARSIAVPPSVLSDIKVDDRSEDSEEDKPPADSQGMQVPLPRPPADDQAAETGLPALPGGGSGGKPPEGGNLPPTGGEGDDNEGDAEGDSRPGEGETSDAQAELAEARRLVYDTTSAVLDKIRANSDATNVGERVKNLTSAIATVDTPEKGHEVAANIIQEFEMTPKEQIPVWAGLVASGDESALTEAHRAIASTVRKQLQESEAAGEQTLSPALSHLWVKLVEAGDKDSAPLARDLVLHEKSLFTQTELLTRLYDAGDDAALDAAIQTNARVKYYLKEDGGQRTSERDYELTQANLHQMSQAALERDRVDDAVKAAEHITDPLYKAPVHANLYAAGREESLQPAVENMHELPEGTGAREDTERALAVGGYAPAFEVVAARVNTGELPDMDREFVVRDRVEDLVALHKSGHATAADQLEEVVRAFRVPERFVQDLVAVGKEDTAMEVLDTAIARYNKESFGAIEANQINLEVFALRLQHDPERWRKLVEDTNYHYQNSGNGPSADHVAKVLKLFAEATKRNVERSE